MSYEVDEDSIPDPGMIVIMPGVGCRRYLVLEQHGKLKMGWCMCDLLNTETGALFKKHSFTNVLGVSPPKPEEKIMFAKYHLGVPTH